MKAVKAAAPYLLILLGLAACTGLLSALGVDGAR